MPLCDSGAVFSPLRYRERSCRSRQISLDSQRLDSGCSTSGLTTESSVFVIHNFNVLLKTTELRNLNIREKMPVI